MQLKKPLPAFLLACVTITVAMWPAAADAQHRHAARSAHVRPVVVVRSPYYRPYYRPYYPYYPYYPWGAGFYSWYGYPFWPYPGYWSYPVEDSSAALRVQVEPKQTEVYVDGYYAGIADDFDGLFQRLHLASGEHELVLYLDGYRAVHQKLYLTPGSTYKVRYTMEKLAPGDTPEPRPAPPAQPAPNAAPAPSAPEAAPAPPSEEPRGSDAEASRYGTLSIRVQPPDAEILIDGEPWHGPEGQDRLAVQVAEGTHKVVVRKEGYDTFSTEAHVRRGETTPLNVSILPREQP